MLMYSILRVKVRFISFSDVTQVFLEKFLYEVSESYFNKSKLKVVSIITLFSLQFYNKYTHV
jgi:hypothetical protein